LLDFRCFGGRCACREEGLSECKEQDVPAYFFEFIKSNGIERTDAVVLPGLESLREEAVRGAKDIMCEGIVEGLDRTRWKALVYDEDGKLVLTLDFSELLTEE
jgi:hypothetical protein